MKKVEQLFLICAAPHRKCFFLRIRIFSSGGAEALAFFFRWAKPPRCGTQEKKGSSPPLSAGGKKMPVKFMLRMTLPG